MTNTTSISVPYEDLAVLRARRENISEICRAAIRQAIAEGEKKSEKVTEIAAAKLTISALPHFESHHQEESK